MAGFRDALWSIAELVDSDAVGERERRILKKGERAPARVLEWKTFGRQGTGTTAPNVRMRLRVEPPGAEPYEVKGAWRVPDFCVHLLDGAVLDAAVDPRQRDRLAFDWDHADTPVVIEADDGERRFDLTRNLPAKREVLEVMNRHGEDMRGNPEARAEVFDVLRRHGFSVDAA